MTRTARPATNRTITLLQSRKSLKVHNSKCVTEVVVYIFNPIYCTSTTTTVQTHETLMLTIMLLKEDFRIAVSQPVANSTF